MSNENGSLFDPKRCKECIMYDRARLGTVQCSNKTWKDGLCKVHHPDNARAIAARKAARLDAIFKRDDLAKAECVASPRMTEARAAVGLLNKEEADTLRTALGHVLSGIEDVGWLTQEDISKYKVMAEVQ